MPTKPSLRLIALVSALALGASSAAALGASGDKQGKKRDQARSAKKDKHAVTGHDRIIAIDRPGHLRVVREFYAGRSLPPGLAKRESLPPGLSKQLRERGRLPPGLQKRLQPVPPDLAGRLPPVPPYYRRYFAGRDLLIVDSQTNRIVAVIRAVVP
jgi:hypothetical protein